MLKTLSLFLPQLAGAAVVLFGAALVLQPDGSLAEQLIGAVLCCAGFIIIGVPK
jgi:hypothetical protein